MHRYGCALWRHAWALPQRWRHTGRALCCCGCALRAMSGLRHHGRQHIGQALRFVLCAMPGLCRDGRWRKGQAQKRRTWKHSRRCCGGRRTARACRCTTTSSPSATAVARRSCTLTARGASPLRVAALLLRASQTRGVTTSRMPHVLARRKRGTSDAASVVAAALQARHDPVGQQAPAFCCVVAA